MAILDKEHFPRDKYCGDAVCTPAIRILNDMGVMQVAPPPPRGTLHVTQTLSRTPRAGTAPLAFPGPSAFPSCTKVKHFHRPSGRCRIIK